MKLDLFVTDAKTKEAVPANIYPMSVEDAEITVANPRWQTSWTTEFIQDDEKMKYALKTCSGELIALGAYSIHKKYVSVEVLYIESHPGSNPTMSSNKKYYGIGKAMMAFGVCLSVNNGCEGCITFTAKTQELAKYYLEQFHATPLPSWGGPQRFMMDGEASSAIVESFLDPEKEDTK